MTTRLYPANAGGNGVPPLTSSTSYTRSATRVDPSTSDASSIGTVEITSSPLVSSPVSASLLVSPSRVNVTVSRAPPSLAIARTTSSFTAHSCIGPVQSSHGTMPADSRVTTSGCSSCVETNSVPSGILYATVMDALGGSSLAGSSPSSAGVSAGVSAGSSVAAAAVAASVSAAASSFAGCVSRASSSFIGATTAVNVTASRATPSIGSSVSSAISLPSCSRRWATAGYPIRTRTAVRCASRRGSTGDPNAPDALA
mmetsp:Transcript_10904/g.50377  ORF Transcript_10904/g.50377 Transcript_10904/m.50377 type:complete len:256 (-) Transcript_10904:80-847(-)